MGLAVNGREFLIKWINYYKCCSFVTVLFFSPSRPDPKDEGPRASGKGANEAKFSVHFAQGPLEARKQKQEARIFGPLRDGSGS